jgi:hypothetical protein
VAAAGGGGASGAAGVATDGGGNGKCWRDQEQVVLEPQTLEAVVVVEVQADPLVVLLAVLVVPVLSSSKFPIRITLSSLLVLPTR